MKYIIRAITYYPFLLSVCLFFEIIMGLYLLAGVIWHFENKDKDTYELFIKYFDLFSYNHYEKYIKGGLQLIKINLI